MQQSSYSIPPPPSQNYSNQNVATDNSVNQYNPGMYNNNPSSYLPPTISTDSKTLPYQPPALYPNIINQQPNYGMHFPPNQMHMAPPTGSLSQALGSIHGNDEIDDDPKGRMPIHGNESNFNINSLLYQNIMESEYFKALYQLRTYHEVIDEIYKRVPHVAPWQTGTSRIPSTAFCLLAKFLVMRLTYNQVRGLLHTNDSPYVRAIGLLYLRYICPPKDLWKWYEEFLEDEEEFTPSSDPDFKSTVGEFCIKLLTDMQYYGTTLPRIPVPIERSIKVLLLLLTEKQKRRKSNLRYQEKNYFVKGTKVRAIFSDEENEPAWYDAVIDYREGDNKYWVTFPEYGNQSCVDLGEIEIIDSGKSKDKDRDRDRDRDRRRSSRSRSRDRRRGEGGGGRRSRSRSRSRGHRRRSRSRSRSRRRSRSRSRSRDNPATTEDLLQKVLREERNSSAAVGRDYGRRPASYKGSLALKVDRFTARKKSRSRSPTIVYRDESRRDGGRDSGRDRDGRDKDKSSMTSSTKTSEMSQAQLENMRKLRERYGDASAK